MPGKGGGGDLDIMTESAVTPQKARRRHRRCSRNSINDLMNSVINFKKVFAIVLAIAVFMEPRPTAAKGFISKIDLNNLEEGKSRIE